MSNIINGTATDYEMPANNYVTGTTTNYELQPKENITGAELDKHDYAENKGRNKEFYKDPTYISAASKSNKDNSTPTYYRKHSRRYEIIGIIMRVCDLAGFELVERVVLRDKATGEVFK